MDSDSRLTLPGMNGKSEAEISENILIARYIKQRKIFNLVTKEVSDYFLSSVILRLEEKDSLSAKEFLFACPDPLTRSKMCDMIIKFEQEQRVKYENV